MTYTARHIIERCTRCGACSEIVACPGAQREVCIGCGACALACPNEAIEMVEEARQGQAHIEVDGKPDKVSERISVKDALIELGYDFAKLPSEPGIFAPCQAGGCWSCVVQINGVLKPSCTTEAREGMKIETKVSADEEPRRIVMNFSEHPIGGVGTPRDPERKLGESIEVICFAGGCNFKCPQCQNWNIAYRGQGIPMTPREAAWNLWTKRMEAGVDRMGISGGESTLNKPWLVQFIGELKRLNPDDKARFHVDTNGSLLTRDYIDALVDAGMTDIGIDLKSLDTDTFMVITGLENRGLAEEYRDIAWEAVEYLAHSYKEKVFLGIGIPYNKELISLEEIQRMGEKLCTIDPALQVTGNNYLPRFRSRIPSPTYEEMKVVYDILKSTGLKTVLCQTSSGFIGL